MCAGLSTGCVVPARGTGRHRGPVSDHCASRRVFDLLGQCLQTQPGELEARPDDVIEGIAGTWGRGCAEKGYDAGEFDTLASCTRAGVALRREDALAVARNLVSTAHSAGLAAAQKNAADDASLLRAAGFDFAIAEECAACSECARSRQSAPMCPDPGTPRSVVLRDRDLVAPSDPGYHCEVCL